ncbi:MAG TPA: hypothetical protein VKQ28_07085 [Candidatus Acidoferrum sp.]|nr:hypothetical protein [Candidatus Acidoferrum sp.]
MPNSFRSFLAVLLSFLLTSPALFAFSLPLSDEAVREAYFLGQRRDETTARFLAKYKQHLAVPKTGPYIASVELLTPFALEVSLSSQQTMGYSAQQAEAAHRGKEELVAINIEVLLTDSYGPLVARPTSERSGSPIGYEFRSPDFWRDIEVQVTVGDDTVKPSHSGGEPNYMCSDGGCQLTGATIRLEFPASAFDSDSATVRVSPPQGPEVWVDFNLTAVR